MLTEEGYREREWGPFPALRKALEGKCIPDRYYGVSSVDDNIFEALHRLVKIAILVREHESVVREIARSVGPGEMYQDLRRLQGELEAACSCFKQHAQHVEALCSKL